MMHRLKLLPLVLIIIFAMASHTIARATTEDCRARPGASAPAGSRWYYRLDRVTQRRCWFLKTGVSHAAIQRQRELFSRSTQSEHAQQAEANEATELKPALPEEKPDLSSTRNAAELTAPEVSSPDPEPLVPHKVTSVTYARPRDQETRFGKSFFVWAGLATILLITGGALQFVGQIRPARRLPPPKPTFFRAPNTKRSKYERPSSQSTSINQMRFDDVRRSLERSNINAPKADKFHRNRQLH
jgi:hypothetical protein